MVDSEVRKGSAPAPEEKLIVAIDYGTTFSGVAFAHSSSPEARTVIIQWPDSDGALEGASSEKVPTKLADDERNNTKWGFELNEQQYFSEFKLGLNPTETAHSDVEKLYRDPLCMKPSVQFNARRLTTDYLRKLREHIFKILKFKFGEGVVETTAIEWVITVPAIWTDSAKGHTISCARGAGMNGKINLVGEPEAATTYVLDTMPPGSLEKGDLFIMCDAGGGTVDLISYVDEDIAAAVVIRELVKGDGDKLGSVHLNQAFLQYFQGKVEDNPGCGKDTKIEAYQRFEEDLKRKWDGTQKQVSIPALGLENDKTKGIVRGKLIVPASDMNAIFDTVVPGIIDHVAKQIDQTKVEKIKAVLLIGGFGQSPYLRKKIQQLVGSDIAVLQPPKGWVAVVQGALLHGLRMNAPGYSGTQVSTRKARHSYGCTATVLFKNREHKTSQKFFDPLHGIYRAEIVDWFIKQGSDIAEGHVEVLKYFHSWPASQGRPHNFFIDILSCEQERGRKLPVHKVESFITAGVHRMAVLDVSFDDVQSRRYGPPEEGVGGKMYYRINVEVRVRFQAAHMDYSLWYLGRCIGSVEATYD